MVNINPTIFREYDIRGVVESDLPDEVVSVIHKAFGTYLQNRGITQAIVGRDSRVYNEKIQSIVIEALRSTGINVIDIGMLTVPVYYFAQGYLGVVGGVMVTASHNPMGWSGFKHLIAPLTTASKSDLDELQKIITANTFAVGQGTYEKYDDAVSGYTQHVLSHINIKRPLKVVIDAGNETAGVINPSILRAAGVEVIEQCTQLGSVCEHEPNPSTVEALQHLAEGVKKSEAHLGIGYDADGDRLGVVDDLGNIIWADRVAMVIARSMLQRLGGGAIVFDVKSSQALADDITAHGGTPVMWKTGHSYIRSKMKEVNAVFAAERSGHFFFPADDHGYDDGLFASLKLMEAVSESDKPLSELMKDFPAYATSPVWHAKCSDELKYSVVDRFTQDMKNTYGAENVIDINGARVQLNNGWALVRASSNIPALVVVFEGKTETDRAQIEQTFVDHLSRYSEIGTRDTWESG